jgi:hypothetical protein
MGLSEKDVAIIVERCRTLPPASRPYVQTDYILNLFLAVLDYRSTAEGVRKALTNYRQRWWDQIRTLDDLKRFLKRYPDTPEGNLMAGSDLWGFRAGRRVSELRNLVKFFEARGVVTQELLTHWARTSQYRDFMGRVKGLSLDVYEGILMRQGYGPIKPAPHLAGFLAATLARQVSDAEQREAIDRASGKLGIRARELDRRIYEYELARSSKGVAPVQQPARRAAEPSVPKSQSLGVRPMLLGPAAR